MADLKGKVALVTGATSGLGLETAAALAGACSATARNTLLLLGRCSHGDRHSCPCLQAAVPPSSWA
jgi:NAD(P)-dependent dehydrogenase (short-subunit alcohol dehydrogenase family)